MVAAGRVLGLFLKLELVFDFSVVRLFPPAAANGTAVSARWSQLWERRPEQSC